MEDDGDKGHDHSPSQKQNYQERIANVELHYKYLRDPGERTPVRSPRAVSGRSTTRDRPAPAAMKADGPALMSIKTHDRGSVIMPIREQPPRNQREVR